MKMELEYLKRNRRVTDNFINKLKKKGFDINYGKHSYWNSQEYVEIGRSRVWLVESDGSNIWYRYQNDVIQEIISTIEIEYKKSKEADEAIENFFNKFKD